MNKHWHKRKQILFYILILTILALGANALSGCSKCAKGRMDSASRVCEGKRYLSEGDFENAIKELKAAVILSSENAEAHYLLGEAYYKVKDFPAAEGEIKKTIALKPKDAKAHNMLGLVLEREGVFDGAKKAFQQAIQLNKNYREARDNILGMEEAKAEYYFYKFATNFIYRISKEYSNGATAFEKGTKEAMAARSISGEAPAREVTYHIYLAKEYFDKCSKLLKETADSGAMSGAVNAVATALEERMMAIEIELEGHALSPGEYKDEFERAAAKVKIADSYYVDAVTELKEMMERKSGLFSEEDFAAINGLIEYYAKGENIKR